MGFVKRNAIALVALVFAITGTGIAASRYVLTSTTQIKPSVLNALARQARITSTRQIAPNLLRELGAPGKNVIVRARSTGPVTTATTQPGVAVPMSRATWTQYPEETDQFAGQYTVSLPSTEQCGLFPPGTKRDHHFVTLGIQFAPNEYALESSISTGSQPGTNTQTFELTSFFEPGKPVSHTLRVVAWDDCTTGVHATVDSASIDVIGVR